MADLDVEATGVDGTQSHVRTIWRVVVDLTIIRFWCAVAMKVEPGEYASMDE